MHESAESAIRVVELVSTSSITYGRAEAASSCKTMTCIERSIEAGLRPIPLEVFTDDAGRSMRY